MSKNLKNSIMHKIEDGTIRMRPRWVYLLGATIGIAGLITFAATAMLALNLIIFLLSHNGKGASLKVATIIGTLPWYLPFIVVLSLLGSVILLRRYDFSYRKNFLAIIMIFIFGLVMGSYLIGELGLNAYLTQKGFMRGFTDSQSVPQSGRLNRIQRGVNH